MSNRLPFYSLSVEAASSAAELAELRDAEVHLRRRVLSIALQVEEKGGLERLPTSDLVAALYAPLCIRKLMILLQIPRSRRDSFGETTFHLPPFVLHTHS